MLTTLIFFKKEKTALKLINSFFLVLKSTNKSVKLLFIGVKKRINVAPCGMGCIHVIEDTIKILGICFSRNKKVEQKKNFLSQIVTIQNAFKL